MKLSTTDILRLRADVAGYGPLSTEQASTPEPSLDAARQVIRNNGRVDLAQLEPVKLESGEARPNARLLRLSIEQRLKAAGLSYNTERSIIGALNNSAHVGHAFEALQSLLDARKAAVAEGVQLAVTIARDPGASIDSIAATLSAMASVHGFTPDDIAAGVSAALKDIRAHHSSGPEASRLYTAAYKHVASEPTAARALIDAHLFDMNAWDHAIRTAEYGTALTDLVASLNAVDTKHVSREELQTLKNTVYLRALASENADSAAPALAAALSTNGIAPSELDSARAAGILAGLGRQSFNGDVSVQERFLAHVEAYAATVPREALATALGDYFGTHLTLAPTGAGYLEQTKLIRDTATRLFTTPEAQATFAKGVATGFARPHFKSFHQELKNVARLHADRASLLPPFVDATAIGAYYDVIVANAVESATRQAFRVDHPFDFRNYVVMAQAGAIPDAVLLGTAKTFISESRAGSKRQSIAELTEIATALVPGHLLGELAAYTGDSASHVDDSKRFMHFDLRDALACAEGDTSRPVAEALLAALPTVTANEHSLSKAIEAAVDATTSPSTREYASHLIKSRIETAAGMSIFG